ncbi:MAG: diaminopimelate epimerase, partial [Campylobacterales bacterium]|nr:diaminopimelate epimerase [Campylobacterales bacterium]
YVVSDMIPPRVIADSIFEDGETWWLINTGVPHLVTIRDNLEEFNIEQMRRLRHKYNANVNVCKPAQDTLYVRTYERGVEDETLACGTGMVACFVRGHSEGLLDDMVKTIPKSGDELYVSLENGICRFGGKVTKTFVAETID